MPTFDLPWPPSTNRYWRKWNNRMVISEEGRAYRNSVLVSLWYQPPAPTYSGRLCVTIEAYPPDKRTRDLDNILKSLLDAMQHAKVYKDDSQIDRLTIERKAVEKPGRVRVSVREMNPDYPEHRPMHESEGC